MKRQTILLAILALSVQGLVFVGMLEKIGAAYERGRYSVYWDCDKSNISVQGGSMLVCKMVNGDVLRGRTTPQPTPQEQL